MNKEQWAQRASEILKPYEDVKVTIEIKLFHLLILASFITYEDTRQPAKTREMFFELALEAQAWMVQVVPEMEELYDNLPEH